MRKLTFIFVAYYLLPFFCFAQTNSVKEKKLSVNEQTQLEKAQLLVEEKNYRLALPIFESLLEKHPSETNIKFFTARCYFMRPDKHALMLQYFLDVYAKNKKAQNIEYNLAEAYFLNGKFDEAVTYSDLYSSKLKKSNELQKKEVEHLNTYIKNAKALTQNPVSVKIENFGNSVNTNASECSPYITTNDSLLIFTYRGEQSTGGLQNAYNEDDKNGLYYEDVFFSTKVNGSWTKPEGIRAVNSTNNDEALCISYDGQKLFISRDNQEDDGDIYMSTLENNEWTPALKLLGDINTSTWEDNCCLSPDGKTLFFCSARPGGYGGKDIYKSTLLPDNTWGPAKNLGDKINTVEDEDDPFFHLDGRLLIFSSKGHNSMGGYDIFKTYLNPADSTWSEAENMGYPINTPNDDIHYSITPGGDKGYYGISKADGFGDNDLYSVEPGITGTMPAMVVVKGIISKDNNPVEATITTSVNNAVYKTNKSNANTGFYQLVFPLGQDYKITWQLNDSSKSQLIEATNAKEYLLKIADINFKTKKDSVIETTVNAGTEVIDGLSYKIQVAAQVLNKNIDRKKIKEYGKIEKNIVDNVARFTLNTDYKTLNEANSALEKIKTLVPDAFIVSIYKNKRYYLYELRKQGIIPEQKK